MSDTVKINKKDFKIYMNWATYEKLLARKQPSENATTTEKADLMGRNMIDNLWSVLERKFIFKPFIFKWRLKRKISPIELLKSDQIIGELITVEDRETGN